MKKIILIISLSLYVFAAVAQKSRVNNLTTFDDKRLHFGFSLGLNTFDFGIKHYTPIGEGPYEYDPTQWPSDNLQVLDSDTVIGDIQSLVPGFSVAIITSLRLNKYFNLRFLPGMSFGERRLVYNIPIIDINSDGANYGGTGDPYFSIKSTFLDFPLLLKYKSTRINNQKPYLIAGGAYRIDISKTGVEDLVRLKRGSFHAEFGIGWDTYLQFFRFSTEFKVSLGLNNILDDGPDLTQRQYYYGAFKELTSNVFVLSFHFE